MANRPPHRRRETRSPLRVPVEVSCQSWAEARALFSANVSASGLFVHCPGPPPIGAFVSVVILLPDRTHFSLSGTVRHHALAGGVARGFGMELDAAQLARVDAYRRLVDAVSEATVVSVPQRETALAGPEIAMSPDQMPGSPIDVSDSVVAELRGLRRSSTAQRATGAVEQAADDDDQVTVQTLLPEDDFGSSADNLPRRSNPLQEDTARYRIEQLSGPDDEESIPIVIDESGPALPPLPGVPAQPALRQNQDASLLRHGQSGRALVSYDGRVPALGLDFGTSRSAIAAALGNEVHALRTASGDWKIESAVGFWEQGAVVGQDAMALMTREPQRVIRSPKRILGRQFAEQEVESFLAQQAMPSSPGPHGEVMLYDNETGYTVEQICAPIIYQLKRLAEAQLQAAVTEAVLTIPVSFDELRKRALRRAAEIAGLKVKAFVEEPLAAALAQRADECCSGLVAIYDFGGGTFDFSLVDVSRADFQVVATAGDSWLGGDDIDEALAQQAANNFWRETEIELRNRVVSWQRLLFACEAAKRTLSTEQQATIRLKEIAMSRSGPLDLVWSIDRDVFTSAIAEVIRRSFATVSSCLELADVGVDQLSAVYLVGGTTYIPAVRAAVASYFGKVPRAFVAPERAVVIGAAVYCADLCTASIASLVDR
ncbi:MAG: Hsp70 family protein [Deltaproteobacteria bacterium]|nr:Hsp70 family protein [Deltaproteobacteria bacterium]